MNKSCTITTEHGTNTIKLFESAYGVWGVTSERKGSEALGSVVLYQGSDLLKARVAYANEVMFLTGAST